MVDAAAVEALTSAFDEALQDLDIGRTDPLAEVVAKKIIEVARSGERNPSRLREIATAGPALISGARVRRPE